MHFFAAHLNAADLIKSWFKKDEKYDELPLMRWSGVILNNSQVIAVNKVFMCSGLLLVSAVDQWDPEIVLTFEWSDLILSAELRWDVCAVCVQEEDLNCVRDRWSEALIKRREYLEEQIKKIINKSGWTSESCLWPAVMESWYWFCAVIDREIWGRCGTRSTTGGAVGGSDGGEERCTGSSPWQWNTWSTCTLVTTFTHCYLGCFLDVPLPYCTYCNMTTRKIY